MQARSADDGFSLVEVLVALGLAMTVLVAVLPQLVVGIRAAGLATVMTEAKGVIQGHFEKMRSLPFHVAPSAERRIDVLDTYFPNLTGPSSPTFSCGAGGDYVKPSVSWSGYVSGGTRCSYEPSANAFYRKVELLTRPGGVEYVLVTNTQFLTSATTSAQATYAPAVAAPPASGYDSQNTVGLDVPVTSQIGVTVTAFFVDRGRLKPVTAYSQISENKRAPVRAQGKVTATALDVGSTTPSGTSLTLSAGVVDISGLLSTASNVNATVAATSARESTEPPAGSIIGPVVAPYQLASKHVTAGGQLLATCELVCWDATAIDAFTMSAAGGLPNAGVSDAGVPSPLEGRVTDVGVRSGIRFGNTKPADRASLDRDTLRLDPSQPLVRLTASTDVSAATCGTSRDGKIAGRGFLHTTATHLETCAEVATSTVSMFPTTFAPDGVVRVTLFQAVARCTVRPRVSQSATYSYGALVEYKNPVGGVSSYTSVPVSGNSATVPAIGPLPSLDTIIHQDAQGTLRLRDYIGSWSTPTASTVSAPKTTPTTAEAALSGVVKVLSKPVRKNGGAEIPDPGDPSSVVSLSLGAVGCYAEDAR